MDFKQFKNNDCSSVVSNYAASAMHAMTRIQIKAAENMAYGNFSDLVSFRFFLRSFSHSFKCQKVDVALNGNNLTRMCVCFVFCLLVFVRSFNLLLRNR